MSESNNPHRLTSLLPSGRGGLIEKKRNDDDPRRSNPQPQHVQPQHHKKRSYRHTHHSDDEEDPRDANRNPRRHREGGNHRYEDPTRRPRDDRHQRFYNRPQSARRDAHEDKSRYASQ